MNSRKVKRLEIYMYDFGAATGSIQNDPRPVVVIQDDRLNECSSTTIVAVITVVIKKEYHPSHVFIGKQYGLSNPSMVLLDHIHTINQCDLGEYIGIIDDHGLLKKIKTGMKKALGLWDYSPKEKSNIQCLCPKCLQKCISSGKYIVRRLDPFQTEKNRCSQCSSLGWNYTITDRT